MKPFFITGLPRTRTAWFANLFTTERTHCFHEWHATALKRNMVNDFIDIDKPYVGNSDCGIPIYWKQIRRYYPKAPVVLIDRGREEVLESLCNAFSDANRNDVAHMLDIVEPLFQIVKDDPYSMVMPYETLTNDIVIEKIWDHCVPTIPIDRKRLELLQQLKTTVKYKTFEETGGFPWRG